MLLTINGPRRPGGRQLPGRLAAAALTLSSLTAMLTACSATASGTPPTPSSLPASLPPIYAAVYGSSEADHTISAAEQLLITQCMAAKGFVYKTAAPTEVGEQDKPRPFGLETLEKPAAAQESHSSETVRNAVKDYIVALYGKDSDRIEVRGSRIKVSRPANGCLADSEKRLLGDDRKRWIRLRIQLYEAEVAALDRLEESPAFQELNKRWSRCIKAAGFVFSTPLQLLGKLPPNVNLKTDPSAKADLACKKDTDYLLSAYTGLAAAQRKELRKTPEALTEWTSLLRGQCLSAHQILTESGDSRSDVPATCPAVILPSAQ